jgi:hypothetical protein
MMMVEHRHSNHQAMTAQALTKALQQRVVDNFDSPIVATNESETVFGHSWSFQFTIQMKDSIWRLNLIGLVCSRERAKASLVRCL